jgi:predicted short-subunit dehydrogenase-like oxidoreductase (DUF2520 family)
MAVAGRAVPAGSARGAALAAALGAAAVPLGALASAGQDLLLVAVSDPALSEVAASLASRPQARVALHTSGSLDASVLAPLQATGTAPGSLHPLMTFPHPLPDPAVARNKVFALDGAPEALALARRLTAAWAAIPVEIPPSSRALYHLAASLAAGGVVTLLALAADLAARLDLPSAIATGYLELARGALAAAQQAPDPALALTGPVARGDLATFNRHRDALAALAPDHLPLVQALARETLRQCERLGPLSASQLRLLAELGSEGR